MVLPAHLFSLLGVEPFYLLVMPAVLWCYDRGLGIRLGLILLTSSLTNAILKLAFGLPRPYWVSSRVRPHSSVNSFGFPSGHAQNAVSVWGRLGWALRRWWALGAAVLLIALISLSRVILGVHFPLDLVGGWLAGGALLGLFLLLEGPVGRGTAKLTLLGQLLLILVLSLGALWLGLSVWASAAARPFPTKWLLSAASAHPAGELLDPRQLAPLFALTGVTLGFGAGAILLRKWGQFATGGGWWLRAGRYAVGSFGVAVLFLGLAGLAPQHPRVFSLIWEYLRYASVGFWISYLAPRLFEKLNLLPSSAAR